MNQFYPRSNSSFKLSSGNSLQSNVVRLNENVFLVDSGIGTPRICLQDELIGAKNTQKIRFENRVGFLDTAAGEPHINKQLLERFFIDLIAGDSIAKQRATARFNDLVGRSTDVNVVASGEPLLVLPRRYRQKRVWMELNKIWRSNSQVKGFVVGRVRAGYSVAIAGFVAFLPFRPFIHGVGTDRLLKYTDDKKQQALEKNQGADKHHKSGRSALTK
ncbi:Ribosomal protein S1 mitochondrial [Bienertia sinuspersici]